MFVFPMAGLSSRFSAAGFTQPKYMLPAGDRSLLEHSISGFSHYFATDLFLFIYLEQAVDPAFIIEACRKRGLLRDHILLAGLSAPTDGQAATVAQGLDTADIADDEPITIFNIDTMYRTFRQPDFAVDPAVDGYLDVFHADGDHWSFVRPDKPGEQAGVAIEVTEKQRISNLCSTGLYHFRTAGLFREAFDAIRSIDVAQLQGRERYVAPLYNRLIGRGGKVCYRVVPATNIRFSGTPAEYDQFIGALPFDYQ